MSKVTFKNLNGQGIEISAVINFPTDFDASKQYAAVVVHTQVVA